MDNIHQIELSEQQIRDEQRQLAGRKGLSVRDAYARLDRGEFRGTILESKLSMLRFLLGEDSTLPTAAA
jgi:hypothetical protein